MQSQNGLNPLTPLKLVPKNKLELVQDQMEPC